MQGSDNSLVTTWYNPTDKPIKMKLYRGTFGLTNGAEDSRLPRQQPWMMFEVPPGEERQLSSEFNDAIQRYDETGQIVDGKGIFLVRMDKKDPPKVHNALLNKTEEEVRSEIAANRVAPTILK